MGPAAFGAAIGEARRRAPGRPVAANLLGPFTKRAHVTLTALGGERIEALSRLHLQWLTEHGDVWSSLDCEPT